MILSISRHRQIVYLLIHTIQELLKYINQALALNPDDCDSNMRLSQILSRVGRGEEALERIETALRLNPIPPYPHLRALGAAYRSLGRFQEAVAVFRKCVERLPNDISRHFPVGAAHT